mgnify:FL=1
MENPKDEKTTIEKTKLTLRPALGTPFMSQVSDVLREAGITLSKDVGGMETHYDNATNILNIICREQIADILEQGFTAKGFKVETSDNLAVSREKLVRQQGPEELQ